MPFLKRRLELAGAAPQRSPERWRTWRRLVMGLGLVLLALVLLLLFFPWDILRGPINRYVSEKTGRHFAITRHLDVQVGSPTRVVLDGVEMANPSWAREAFLLTAQRVELELRLWPLLSGQWVLPSVKLQQPVLGLQQMPDGRRSWALDLQQSEQRELPEIGALVVDRGVVHYFSPGQRVDLRAELALVPEASAALPLSFKAQGQWRGQSLQAQGRSGGVLQFSASPGSPFPLELALSAGATRLQARGQVAQLARLEGLAAHFELKGKSLAELEPFFGGSWPESPPYQVSGQLDKRGTVWDFQSLQAAIGRSDLHGALRWSRDQALPLLTGDVSSRQLDLRDFGPLLGAGRPQVGRAAPRQQGEKRDKVLPAKVLDFKGLSRMNADVRFNAERISGAPAWPLDSARAHIKVQQGALQLQSLRLGVAGGEMSGQLALDSSAAPANWQLRLDGRSLQLNRLFPAIETNRSSLGQVSGKVDLKGRGQSVAQVLGSASGDLSLLMGGGRISNILLEFVGLDGAEIAKFVLSGDRVIGLRCAAAAFDVRQGLMSSRVLVMDTVDTIIRGAGTISLAQETLDLRLEPQPKDVSILTLRSPLHIGGTFAAPDSGPVKGALMGRAGLAIALAAINPLLGLAATIETGPGKDAPCTELLRRASTASVGTGASALR